MRVKEKRVPMCLHLLGYMLIAIPVITIYVTTCIPVVHASEVNSTHFSTSCARQTAPGAQSLLAILLGKTNHTPPNASDNEIVSAVEMLMDLWPGKLAIISAGNTASLLSITQQNKNLQQQIENSSTGNAILLDPALKTSEDVLQQEQFPAGSRILAITYQNDDSPSQSQDIQRKLIPQFAQQCIPIDTLFISSNGYHLNTLLSDIAKNTAATYNIASKPSALIAEVLNLYAQWQGMSFIQAQPLQAASHNDLITVDKFVTRISIVIFHPDSPNDPVLIGPDSQPVEKGVQTLQGLHYMLKSFTVAAHLQPGTYIVNTGNANTTQVWSLIQSPLQLQVIQPGLATIAQADQPVSLQARFIDNDKFITPKAGSAQIPATVSLLSDQLSQSNFIVLHQQTLLDGNLASIFQGGTIIYKKSGELRIEFQGTYQQALRQAYLTIWLALPPSLPLPLQKQQPWFPPEPNPILVVLFVAVLFFMLSGTVKSAS